MGLVESICESGISFDVRHFLRQRGDLRALEADTQEAYAEYLGQQGSAQATLTIDGHSTILGAGGSPMALLGYSPKDLLNKSLHMLMPDQRTRELHDAGLRRYVASRQPGVPREVELPVPIVMNGGAKRTVILSIRDAYEGETPYFAGTMRSTGFPDRLQVLPEHALFYHLLVEALPVPAWVHDADLKVLYVNRAAQERYGYSRKELAGMHLSQIIPEDYQKIVGLVRGEVQVEGDRQWVRHVSSKGEHFAAQAFRWNVPYAVPAWLAIINQTRPI